MITKYQETSSEISDIFGIEIFDMLHVDCENLKTGLSRRANQIAEKLITSLVSDYVAENTR